MASRKNKKTSKGALGILIVVILMFGVITYTSNQSFNLSGGTVLGISSVQVLSGNNQIEEQFLFDIVVNGGGESVSGVINPKDIERFGVSKIPKVFTIEFSLLDVSCNYRIENTDKSLFKVYQSTAVERNLQSNPPYGKTSLVSTILWCETGAPDNFPKASPGFAPSGGVCLQMEEIGEWGYWSPEQSNTIISGRREDNVGSLGDWRSTHIGGIPFYNVLDIGTRGFIEYNVLVKVTNSEDKVVETTLNSKEKTALLGDYGRVKLVGNLQADELCDIPAIRYSVIENEDGKKFVDKSWVDTYFNNYRNLIGFDNDYFEFQWKRQRIDPGVGADWIFGSVSGMNNALNQLSLQNLSIGCEISGSTTICEPEGDLVYPEIQLLMDADYIGVSKDLEAERDELLNEIQRLQKEGTSQNQDRISSLQEQLNNLKSDVTPVINLPTNGIPKLGEIDNNEVIANDVGNIAVIVKNVGTQADSFDVDLSCETDISFGSKRVSLEPNQEKIVDIKFNGNEGSYDCTITARSVNNPNNADSKSLIVSIKKRPTPESPEFLEGGTDSSSYNIDNGFLMKFIVVFVFVATFYLFKPKLGSSKRGKKKK